MTHNKLKIPKVPTKSFILLAFLFSFYHNVSIGPRNISGKNGLIYIPDATVQATGTWSLGFVYLPKEKGLRYNSKLDEQILFTTLDFSKRLELSFLLLQTSRFDGIKNKDGIGDRQIDIRYQIFTEKKNRPAVSVILSSPFSVDAALQTNVIVATKSLKYKTINIKPTIGLGSPFYIYRDESNLNNYNAFSKFALKKKSEDLYKNNYLVGLFGGVNIQYKNKVSFMAEWDSNNLNAGLHIKLLKKLNAHASLIGMKNLSCGIFLEQSLY